MARVNVYFPDDLIERARAAKLNVSEVAQAAIRGELEARDLSRWLDAIAAVPAADVSSEEIRTALDDAREDLGW